MSYLEDSSISCGVRELVELGMGKDGVKGHVRIVAHHLCNIKDTFTFVLFSDNDDLGNGRKLAAYIRRNKLGTLLETTPRHNRNHPDGPKIRVWTWTPFISKLEKYKPKKLSSESDGWGGRINRYEDGYVEEDDLF